MSLFQEVNDRIRKLAGRGQGQEPWEFVCECDDDACIDPVSLTVAEFDEHRRTTARITAHAGALTPGDTRDTNASLDLEAAEAT